MATREEQLEAIQHFGSQHPQFHSKEMKEYRRKAKSQALHNKKKEVAGKMGTRERTLLRRNEKLSRKDMADAERAVRAGLPRYKD